MTMPASKRVRGERPSKEERQRALMDAIKLPTPPSRPAVPPAVAAALPGERPTLRRSRAKYAD